MAIAKEKKGLDLNTILIILAVISVLSALAIPFFKSNSVKMATAPQAPVSQKTNN
jgi:Tfp pilus assembly protein FimT